MRDYISIFIIHTNDIFELLLSKERDNGDTHKLSPSEFLIAISTHGKRSWKEWLIVTAIMASGQGFRIDGFRDYSREQGNNCKIDHLLDNEFFLQIDIDNKAAKLKILPEFTNFISTFQKLMQSKLIKASRLEWVTYEEKAKKMVRTLDMGFIGKKFCLVAPTLEEVNLEIIEWKPDAYKRYYHRKAIETMVNDNIDITTLSSWLSEKMISVNNWEKFRQKKLEQPFGLVCSSCNMHYQANLYAKKCFNCGGSLIKA